MVIMLDEDSPLFIDPLCIPADEREEDGLYAIGGDLSPDRLQEAYKLGIFPWTAFRDMEIPEGAEPQWWNLLRWYCPLERFVIFPGQIHVSHSMRTLINRREYECSIDKAFDSVIEKCAEFRIEEDGAWLGPQMMEAYKRLHSMGLASSVEVWKEGELVGGLYGVTLNGCFFGESMFSRVPSGSKLALIHLALHMQATGGKMIDCQLETPHLKSMGGRMISYEHYRQLIMENGELII